MPMLTLDELYAANIQPDVAKEAYSQVEKRLADLLETKKSFETRAATMLTAFITLAWLWRASVHRSSRAA